jgi:hypothetical protein
MTVSTQTQDTWMAIATTSSTDIIIAFAKELDAQTGQGHGDIEVL